MLKYDVTEILKSDVTEVLKCIAYTVAAQQTA